MFDNRLTRNEETTPRKHCDAYVNDINAPNCLRHWLIVHRLPASEQIVLRAQNAVPQLFADYQGTRVRLLVASRLGDVGITYVLDGTSVYACRVWLDELTNFSTTKER